MFFVFLYFLFIGLFFFKLEVLLISALHLFQIYSKVILLYMYIYTHILFRVFSIISNNHAFDLDKLHHFEKATFITLKDLFLRD